MARAHLPRRPRRIISPRAPRGRGTMRQPLRVPGGPAPNPQARDDGQPSPAPGRPSPASRQPSPATGRASPALAGAGGRSALAGPRPQSPLTRPAGAGGRSALAGAPPPVAPHPPRRRGRTVSPRRPPPPVGPSPAPQAREDGQPSPAPSAPPAAAEDWLETQLAWIDAWSQRMKEQITSTEQPERHSKNE